MKPVKIIIDNKVYKETSYFLNLPYKLRFKVERTVEFNWNITTILAELEAINDTSRT